MKNKLHYAQRRRKHLKLGGAQHFEGTFFLRERGHFLKIERVFFVYCKIFGGHVPPLPPGSYVYDYAKDFLRDSFMSHFPSIGVF